jgi:hypothetical protein
MYLAIVALTMLVLPLGSIAVEHGLHGAAPLMGLVSKWFVFWGVGVRLGLAGGRQVLRPGFTARDIFRLEDEGALPLVRELGVANLGAQRRASRQSGIWSEPISHRRPAKCRPRH